MGISDAWDGLQLRSLRDRAGLTLGQAAAQTGFSVSHLSNVERGIRAVTEDVARAYLNLRQMPASRSEPATHLAERRSTPDHPSPVPGASKAGAADDFGTRLMRLRLAGGLSLAQLARDLHVSKSFLGNLEYGRRLPSPELAESCDAHLVAGGVLVALAAATRSARSGSCSPGGPAADEVPARPPHERELRAAVASAERDAEFAVVTAQERLLNIRRRAQLARPHTLTAEAADAAVDAARSAFLAGPGRREALWLLAARTAEITGWLIQEAGYEATADLWTQAAATWAGLGGDPDMRGYRWERRALGTLYRGRGAETVALARRAAAEAGVSPRIAGLALRREAQGHALAGDRAACERALDEATRLLERGPSPFPRGLSWGPNSIADDSDFVPAACLVDLGAWRAAAEMFGPCPASRIPAGAVRTRARVTVRGALAFALAGELNHACALAETALPDVVRVGSATISADIQRLINVLSRHSGHEHVRTLLPDLHNMRNMSGTSYH